MTDFPERCPVHFADLNLTVVSKTARFVLL